MITESLSSIKDLLIELIDESLNLIKKSENIDYKIKDKNQITGDNPVTEIDLKTQNLIISKINRKFPKHAILGEEGESKKVVKADYLWIIDPIDGTKNFINDLPLFSVSIAVMFKGNIVAGGIGAALNTTAFGFVVAVILQFGQNIIMYITDNIMVNIQKSMTVLLQSIAKKNK